MSELHLGTSALEWFVLVTAHDSISPECARGVLLFQLSGTCIESRTHVCWSRCCASYLTVHGMANWDTSVDRDISAELKPAFLHKCFAAYSNLKNRGWTKLTCMTWITWEQLANWCDDVAAASDVHRDSLEVVQLCDVIVILISG